MFYVSNVTSWLDEVLLVCRDKSLDPEDSIFLLLLFSSLDSKFVKFFRKRKKQISNFSGSNVHIFTPIIFDQDIIPDNEVRQVRKNFIKAGIMIGNRPSAVMFRLQKRSKAKGYRPLYFAAYEIADFHTFKDRLRDLVEACIDHRDDEKQLIRRLSLIARNKNLIEKVAHDLPFSEPQIKEIIEAPRVFVSYASTDGPSVQAIYRALSAAKIPSWLDKRELVPGANIYEEIKDALKKCDALILILSRNSLKSHWVPFEGALFSGQSDTKPLIPVVLDEKGKAQANNLPFVKGRYYIDLSQPASQQANLEKLIDFLRKA